MSQYKIFRWLEEPHDQPTPLLFVGELASLTDLQKGMIIYHIDRGVKYRLDHIDFENERDERNGVKRLTMTTLYDNGEEGKKKVASTLNGQLCVWKADIDTDLQELFYGGQTVYGKVIDGTFIPEDQYMVNWYQMFMTYFDIIARNPYRDQTRVERQMPRLVRECIEQFGVGIFNEMIRSNYAGKEMSDAVFREAWNSIFDSDWLYHIDRRLSFPKRVLEKTMSMSTCFEDVVKTVVFKQGIKLDISRMI